MLASALRWTWQMADSYLSSPTRGGFVGRAFSPAAWGLPPPQGFRGDVSIVPCGGGAMSCRILQDISAASRQCPPPSAPYGASTSPCRGGFGKPPPGRLPCKGLRSRAPPAADTARRSRCSGRRMQARFSVRRMMRIPQTGNGVSRLRGAAPCPANTLPGCLKPPRPCGAALTQNHSAPFATLPGGRSRPPYNITYTCNGAGSGSLPPLRRGRCSHRPADGPGKKLPLSYHLPFPAAM